MNCSCNPGVVLYIVPELFIYLFIFSVGKSEKVREIEVSQLDYDVAIDGDASRSGKISSEASKILSNLPNLLVMEKQYIVFPIR